MTYEAKGKDRTLALFVQDEFAIQDNLTLYLGARQDSWETFDGSVNQASPALNIKYNTSRYASLSPKGSIVYKPFGQTTFKISGGKAFRAPSIYDLYRTTQDHGGKTSQSNPDLKPETALSWDAGVTQGLWSGMTVKATYFENYIEDLIYTKTVNTTTTQKINAGKRKAKASSWSGTAVQHLASPLCQLYLYGCVIKENSAAPSSVGKKVTGIPQHMINLGMQVKAGQFSGLLTVATWGAVRHRRQLRYGVQRLYRL